jgi:hypothetical protein
LQLPKQPREAYLYRPGRAGDRLISTVELRFSKTFGKQTNIGSTLTGVYNPNDMNKRRHNPSVMLLLFVCILTNAFGWAFNGEVFAHELDYEHHVLSLDPTAHLEAHQHAAINDDSHLDAATHLCLHAAGQYQPFFFTAPLLVPASLGVETPMIFISVAVPESIPDSPLHPPRNISAS